MAEMIPQWFAIHTYSGQENKIKNMIEEAMKKAEWQNRIFQVLLPFEERYEVKNGKKRKVQKKYFPSYLLIQMVEDEDIIHFVLNIPGVTNFLGAKNKPAPLTENEVNRLVAQLEEKRESSRDRYPYHVGEQVKIVDGPFKTFTGIVDHVNPEKNKIRVMVRIFGRATPVELNFEQVTTENK